MTVIARTDDDVLVTLDDNGRIVDVNHGGKHLTDAAIRRVLALRGPLPTDAKAAEIRQESDALLSVLLRGDTVTPEAVAKSRAARKAYAAPAMPAPVAARPERPRPQTTMVDPAIVDDLERAKAHALALAFRAQDVMSLVSAHVPPEHDDYKVAARVQWVANRQLTRQDYILHVARNGLTEGELTPLEEIETLVLPEIESLLDELKATYAS